MLLVLGVPCWRDSISARISSASVRHHKHEDAHQNKGGDELENGWFLIRRGSSLSQRLRSRKERVKAAFDVRRPQSSLLGAASDVRRPLLRYQV